MDSVVFLGDADPDYADGVSRAGRDFRFGLVGVGVPEEVGVVVEGRIIDDVLHFPLAERERIVAAAGGAGEYGQDFTVGIEGGDGVLGFTYVDGGGLEGHGHVDVGDPDFGAGLVEGFLRVQFVEERRA